MTKYSVEIVPRAEKEYLKLPQTIKIRFQRIILSLENDPKPFGSKKLRETDYYRLRSGDYRIVYSVDDKLKVVRILSIGHRKEVYRSF